MFKRIIYVFVLVIAILFTAFILPSENAFADETLLHDELIEETNCIETSEEVGNDETVETSEIPTDSLLETEDVPETENISESEAEAEVPEFSSDNIDIEQNEVESILEDSINSEDLSIDQPTPMIGYTKSSVNVRSMPNGDPIGTISLGQQVSGNLENDWLKISFNNSVGYIHSSLIQENPVQVNRYIMGGTNIRNRPNGSVIEYLDLPLHVNATIEGSWLKFMRNGQMCYVHQVRTQTDAPTITGYASTQINLRTSPNGTLVGRTLRGERVEGTLEGNWVRYNRNGLICYLYAPLLKIDRPQICVYIDVGHGGTDSGAYYYGVKESNLNLNIGNIVKAKLVDLGYKVLMPRNSDITIELLDRAIDANENQPDIFVSIHHNAHPNAPAARGMKLFIINIIRHTHLR